MSKLYYNTQDKFVVQTCSLSSGYIVWAEDTSKVGKYHNVYGPFYDHNFYKEIHSLSQVKQCREFIVGVYNHWDKIHSCLKFTCKEPQDALENYMKLLKIKNPGIIACTDYKSLYYWGFEIDGLIKEDKSPEISWISQTKYENIWR